MPKCEIFDRLDYHDFYIIKPFWGDDFGAKIKTCYYNLWRSYASFNFDAHAERTHHFLTHMLSVRIKVRAYA